MVEQHIVGVETQFREQINRLTMLVKREVRQSKDDFKRVLDSELTDLRHELTKEKTRAGYQSDKGLSRNCSIQSFDITPCIPKRLATGTFN